MSIFNWAWLKILSDSQTLILNQQYLKKKLDQVALFFAFWDRLKEDKSWFGTFLFGEVKKALKQSDCKIPESTWSQIRIDDIE